MDSIVIEFVKIIPSVLWLIFIIVLIIVLYRPIKNDLLPRLNTFEAAGVKFSFIRESIDAAIALAEELNSANHMKSEKWNVHIRPDAAAKAEKRAQVNFHVFKNTQILWVDDHPEFNLNERNMFEQLGVKLEIIRNTEQALQQLRAKEYDLIISDIARDDDMTAGLTFLEKLMQNKNQFNLIFYIGRLDSHQVPDGAFGITNRPDELLHLTMDVLERVKY